MKVLVTGSTGFVGNNQVVALVKAGHDVLALARSVEKAQKVLKGLPVKIIQGDITNVAGFADWLDGCEVLFHTAAYFNEYKGGKHHWEKLQAANVDGTLALFNQAYQRGVKKVIYISTAGVIGYNPAGIPASENTPPAWYSTANLYFKSKLIAEQEIDRFLQKNPLPVVFLNPCTILGPSDVGPTNTGNLVVQYLSGKLPAAPAGGFDIVDARDVAQASLNAIEYGQAGERYLLSGGHFSMTELFQSVSQAAELPDRKIRLLPYGFASTVARANLWFANITNSDAALSPEDVRFLHEQIRWDGSKAKRELKVNYHATSQTIAEAVKWFQHNGYVKA